MTENLCNVPAICFLWGILLGLIGGTVFGWIACYLIVVRPLKDEVRFLSKFCELYDYDD